MVFTTKKASYVLAPANDRKVVVSLMEEETAAGAPTEMDFRTSLVHERSRTNLLHFKSSSHGGVKDIVQVQPTGRFASFDLSVGSSKRKCGQDPELPMDTSDNTEAVSTAEAPAQPSGRVLGRAAREGRLSYMERIRQIQKGLQEAKPLRSCLPDKRSSSSAVEKKSVTFNDNVMVQPIAVEGKGHPVRLFLERSKQRRAERRRLRRERQRIQEGVKPERTPRRIVAGILRKTSKLLRQAFIIAFLPDQPAN